MSDVRGLRSRLCPECKEITPHRTLYVKAREDGRRRWLQVFWFCTRCHSLNHIVLPAYRLERVASPLPTSLALGIVNILRRGPMDLDELIMHLRKDRPEGVRHVFNQEVRLSLEFLKGRSVIREESSDRTARVMELLQTNLRQGHLVACPRESPQGASRMSLVSLYAQKSNEHTNTTKLVSVGVLCRTCQYVCLDELG